MEKTVYSKTISMNIEDLEIHIELMNRRNSSMKFNDKNLQKTYNFLLEGKVESLYIGSCERIRSRCSDETVINHYPTLCTIAFGCNLAATYRLIFPIIIYLQMTSIYH
jgi:hypothetical protein